MLEMKKEGKSVEEIKAFVLAEKKKAAAAALQGASAEKSYTLEQLRKKPSELDSSKLEIYLSDTEFKKAFSMSKIEFSKLPGWKKTDMKKKLQLH